MGDEDIEAEGGGGGGGSPKIFRHRKGGSEKIAGLRRGGGSKNLYTSKPTGGLGGGPKKLNC